MLDKLIAQWKEQGDHVCNVLYDYMVESGATSEAALQFINMMRWGKETRGNDGVMFVPTGIPMPAFSNISYFSYFDTVGVQRTAFFPSSLEAEARGFLQVGEFFVDEFFRDLQGKTETETNCYTPRCLPAGSDANFTSMTLRRLDEKPIIEGALTLRLNMKVIAEVSAVEFEKRGIFGLPLNELRVGYIDDIRATLKSRGHGQVQFALHGLIRRDVR